MGRSYSYFRNGVVIYTVVVQGCIIARLQHLKTKSLVPSSPSAQQPADKTDYRRMHEVLSALVDKMQYYPLVQVVTRAGVAWQYYS